ncbi:MAG: TetR/AcrR family transcriptional regulator [Mucilaginibacter sp.]|nr:TetR/AcrR family transcriptional regulator [Mucilaginibacter sp.]
MTKGEVTRALILERSAPIFNTKGIAGTSLSDIMKATNLSKGALYLYFENKEVLANAVVDHNMELLGKKVNDALKRKQTAKEKLFAFIQIFYYPMLPPVAGGCPMMNFGTEADEQSPVIKEKVDQMVNISQQLIADIIKKGIKDGEFKSDWDEQEFATVMFAMIEGGIMICRANGNNDKMKLISANLKKTITAQLL